MGLECALVYILEYFELAELLRISQVCHLFRERVKSRLLRLYVRILRRWVSGPTELRDVLRNTHSVISGSTALTYALGGDVNWESNDLDIFPPVGRPCDGVLDYLTEKEGYKVTDSYIDPNQRRLLNADEIPVPPPVDILENYEGSIAYSRLRNVYKLSKVQTVPGSDETRRLSIDVIEARGTSAIIPIFRFHSSLVMNYVSADSLFMAYPNLTLQHNFIPNKKMNRYNIKARRWLEKYSNRGFEKWTPGEGKSCGSACYPMLRSTRDVGCLDFAFGDEDTNKFEEAQWTMSQDDFPSKEESCSNWSCPRGTRKMMEAKDGTRLRWRRVAVLGSNSVDENGGWVEEE